MVSTLPASGHARLAFLLTVLGTVPYLALKVQWLSGGDAGVSPGLDMHSPTLTIANLVTLILDAVVIALAWALVGRLRVRTVRLVAPLVWGATGLMTTPVVTYLVVIVTDSSLAEGTDLAPWVYAAVYGSFAAQAMGLLALLLLRMHRPQQTLRGRRPGYAVSVLASLAAGAWHLHRAAAGPLAGGAPAALEPVNRVAAAVTGALALGSALSMLMMSRSVSSEWVALSWVCSGAMACFSGYLLLVGLLNELQPNDVPRPLLVVTLVAGAVTAVNLRREFDRRLPSPVTPGCHTEGGRTV